MIADLVERAYPSSLTYKLRFSQEVNHLVYYCLYMIFHYVDSKAEVVCVCVHACVVYVSCKHVCTCVGVCMCV